MLFCVLGPTLLLYVHMSDINPTPDKFKGNL